MDDLQTGTPNPTPSAETPAGGATAAQPEVELELEEVGDDQSAGTDDDLEDFEDEGKTYKIPKALKPRLMKDADYTRKTQEIAERGRALDARNTEIEETAKFHRENVREVAKLVHIDEQLEAFRNLTPEQWAQIERTDAAQAAALQRQFNMLKDQRERAIGDLQQKQQQALEKQRTTTAKQYEDGLARIAKKIPGWSEDLAGKLNGYATSQGFELEELQGFIPRKNAEAYVGVLHKSYLYDQLVAKQRARAAAPAEPAPTPVAKVGARRSAPTSEPLDSDPPDVWLRKRNKQLQAANR